MKAQGTPCTHLNISKAYLDRWHKDLPANIPKDLLGLDTSSSWISMSSKEFMAKSKKHHAGPTGFLDDVSKELICYVMEWYNRGMPVTCYVIVQKVTQLKPELRERFFPACIMFIFWFMLNNDLVHHCATYTAQCLPKSIKVDALSFLTLLCPKSAMHPFA